MNRLRQKYEQEIRTQLKEELGYANVHQIPKVEKVVVNAGVGRAVADSKHLEVVSHTISKVTGQHPVATVAKNSIAGFKLREGNKIGMTVTLRGERMYEFLDRLVSITLVFPEISFEEASNTHGLQINVITTAKTREESKRLLELMGFPFRRNS
jgi:large subunit ribosomal protein L5